MKLRKILLYKSKTLIALFCKIETLRSQFTLVENTGMIIVNKNPGRLTIDCC